MEKNNYAMALYGEILKNDEARSERGGVRKRTSERAARSDAARDSSSEGSDDARIVASKRRRSDARGDASAKRRPWDAHLDSDESDGGDNAGQRGRKDAEQCDKEDAGQRGKDDAAVLRDRDDASALRDKVDEAAPRGKDDAAVPRGKDDAPVPRGRDDAGQRSRDNALVRALPMVRATTTTTTTKDIVASLDKTRPLNRTALMDLWLSMSARRMTDGTLDRGAGIAIRICPAFDGDAYKSCWSVLRAIDPQKCARELDCAPGSEGHAQMVQLVDKIRSLVDRVHVVAAAGGLDARVSRYPGTSHLPETSTSNDDNVADVLAAIADLDFHAHVLAVCAVKHRDEKSGKYLSKGRFTALNCSLNEEHERYLRGRISFLGGTNSEFENKLSGYFLIAVNRVMRDRIKVNVIEDRSEVLSVVLNKYVRGIFFGRDDIGVPVYVNISETRHVERLNVLRSDGKESSSPVELALVQLARATYNGEKNFVAVKAYVSCLFVSGN